jgi:predicted metal-dependent phosphoesterase TrpH
MHTTASDGRLTPVELVARAAAAGLTTISVTDHDTVAAIAEVTGAAQAPGIRVVPGIEITSVEDGRDVHMLGYFVDPAHDGLAAFLVNQRELRVARLRAIADRLSAANMFVDVESLIRAAAAKPGSSVGRPQVAREMVRSGLVASIQEAFDVWLATGRPGFVPRTGPSPADVVNVIHAAGGVASFAHPGVTNRDDLIASLAERGLDAIEVYHSDHAPDKTAAYRRMAAGLSLLVSGGSDFHGEDPSGRASRPQRATFGAITLPPADFARLESAAARIRASHSGAASRSQ